VPVKFVERVGARANDFSLSGDDASIVAEICRKLDGIVLAVELAAGRAAILVRDTIARLDSRLDLLKFGRRNRKSKASNAQGHVGPEPRPRLGERAGCYFSQW
jgi:predicted ATPase